MDFPAFEMKKTISNADIHFFFLGGYHYSLKMYVYEKVRARNFGRAWGFIQFSQSIPNGIGIPISGTIKKYYCCPQNAKRFLVHCQFVHFRLIRTVMVLAIHFLIKLNFEYIV